MAAVLVLGVDEVAQTSADAPDISLYWSWQE